MSWDLSCVDWEDRIRTGRSLIPDLPLWREPADRALEVFGRLRLSDVSGTPRLSEAAGPWFAEIVQTLHGSLNPETGERYIREVFCLTPKKQSKTSYSAALMLCSLLVNTRPNALFLLVAPTHDVAEIAFSQASGMVRLDAGLSEILHVQQHLKRISDRRNGARLEILSFAPEILTGQKPAGVLLDEVHVIGSVGKAASAIGQLRGGMVAYPEAFLMFITTQSDTPPAGVFRSELNRARAIRDNRITGRMLPILYEFPSDIARDRAKWADPTNWPMVTPNRGRSITIERLVEDYAMAVEIGEEEVRRWASQHLNVEIGVGLHSDRWVGAEHWEACAQPEIDLAYILDRSDVIVVGCDGGGMDDLLGLAVLGRETGTRRWLLVNHAWAHVSVLDRRKSEAGRLRDFERDGSLTIVERLPEDLDGLAEIVERIDRRGLLAYVGLDPAGAGPIMEALAERGIENRSGSADRVIGVSQGYRLMSAVRTLERKLLDNTIAHAAQPLMSWAVGNARIEIRSNAVYVTKAASGTAKIDPLMATFNAVEAMSRNPASMVSIYETRGLAVLDGTPRLW